VLGFLSSTLALQLCAGLGLSFGNRYAFFQAFFAQAAVAELCAVGVLMALSRSQDHLPVRADGALRIGLLAYPVLVALLTARAVVTVQARQTGSVTRHLGFVELLLKASTHDAYYRRLAALSGYVSRSDVVLTSYGDDGFDVPAMTGARVVAARFAFRVPDAEDRIARVVAFYSKPDGMLLWDMVQRYRVTKVLVTQDYIGQADEIAKLCGPPLLRTNSLALFYAPRR
jgi:hypothetical protein